MMRRDVLLLVGLVLVICLSATAYAAAPAVVFPFGTEPVPTGPPGPPGAGDPPYAAGPVTDALQDGADEIISYQCADGGWGWPHENCPTTTYYNITGPIAMGLLDAYEATSDANHLSAAVDAGDFDLTSQWTGGEARFGTGTPAFMVQLSDASSDSTYSDFAETEFFDELAAGTYGDSDWDTAGFITAVQTARTGTWVNLRPWEFHRLVDTAAAIGNAGQNGLFLAAMLDGLNTLDNTAPATVYSDLIGLSGAVRGLALNGTTSFAAINSPNHGLINGINNLQDLADVLAAQQNGDGSWYWHSNLGTPGVSDEDSQTTAYAVMALATAGPFLSVNYGAEVEAGRDWLLSMQLPSGGFLSYPGGDQNTEVEGEVLSALRAAQELLGACCNRITGVCQNDVEEIDCDGPDDEFSAGVLCNELVPLCTPAPRGSCCDESDFSCVNNVLQRDCDGPLMRWTDGVDCLDLVPPCEELPAEIPTVGQWGLVVMTILGLAAGSILFGRFRRATA